jgi:hypothetical protein
MTAKSLAAATILALALAACATTKPAATTASTGSAPAVAWAACLRAHGVPAFPDPIPGHKAQFSDSSANILNSRSPAVLAAEKACKAQHDAIIGTRAGPSADENAAFLEFARCMRAHGVPNYPDPTYGGNGRPNIPDLSSRGIDAQSPAVTKAARACNGHGIPLG